MPTAQPPYPRAVYIVEQHPGGQSSTIHISRGVNRNAETQNKTGTQFTTTSTQPGQINEAALERENPVKTRYDQLTKGQIGIWIAAAVVLSLAAAVISKHPERTVLSACSVNIAVVSSLIMQPILQRIPNCEYLNRPSHTCFFPLDQLRDQLHQITPVHPTGSL